jgi:hypothetical protein
MLWRVRTTLADRPGALAALAQRCGDRDVNILGLQVFPGVDGVTDELVLRAPGGWGLADVAELVEDAGGRRVTVSPCTVHALHDAPTRYLQAARRLVDDPADLARVLAGVLDAQADDSDPAMRAVQETIEVGSGSTIRRITPFTGSSAPARRRSPTSPSGSCTDSARRTSAADRQRRTRRCAPATE